MPAVRAAADLLAAARGPLSPDRCVRRRHARRRPRRHPRLAGGIGAGGDGPRGGAAGGHRRGGRDRGDGPVGIAGGVANLFRDRGASRATGPRVRRSSLVQRQLAGPLRIRDAAAGRSPAPEERRVIQLGSVFGRAFRPPGLLALEPNLEGLDQVVDRLVDKDLLRPTGTDIFAFRHILIREVAFQTLTRAERGRLHAAAAAWLEGLAGEREDSLAELIAFHYREAATMATAQRPGEAETERIRRKAVDWLGRAADVAAAGAASVEGSRHLRSAIELAEPTRLPDLYQRLGEMAESGAVIIDAFQTALRLCREQGRPPTQQLKILAGLLTTYMRFQGSVADRLPAEAMAELRRDARAVAAQVTDERVLAAYHGAEGFFPFWTRAAGRLATPAEIAEADASA